ncbi:methylmalonyl-CoA epimerase [Candidatus Paracaedibacter symbiosus]|uniref:methylmalonyl-CoA epimerase n=1 Tax=Candidatus Paracaedibacter symbiosus TaxID=244582 RepID=UPI0005099D39|nr:methylmalonyl-CoA epimerase [Candidatus Paracaedibacter symbiosus]
MLKRLNHIAIAVPNLEQATSFYRDILGAQVSKAADLPEHGVTTVFVNLDNTKIELLFPLGEKSPIAGFLAKNPTGGIHHFCIEVDDIFQAHSYLKEKGIRPLTEPKPGAHGINVIFLHPKDCLGCLVELEESSSNNIE